MGQVYIYMERQYITDLADAYKRGYEIRYKDRQARPEFKSAIKREQSHACMGSAEREQALPHYFMEFDVLDRENGKFLDTPSRHELLKDLPICHVPVLASSIFNCMEEILKYLGNSLYITDAHTEHLREDAEKLGLDADRICRETDASRLMEGIYIKVEEDGEVVDRMKYVRASFLQTVEESQSHWLDRPIVPNRITKTIDELFV